MTKSVKKALKWSNFGYGKFNLAVTPKLRGCQRPIYMALGSIRMIF